MTRLPDARTLGDPRQFASVRRIVLDEGAEKGVGALAFSTGGGLDFWLLIDRALDIGPLWRDGRPVAWQSPAGFRNPALVNPESDGGFGFGRGFSGFLMTCGIDHIRGPRDGHPQHGRLPFLPARLTSYGEDHAADVPVLFASGEIIQWRHGGEGFCLRRTVSAPIGGRSLTIVDEVENLNATPQIPSLLYHFNIGAPALTPETMVTLDDIIVSEPCGAPYAEAPDTAFSLPLPHIASRCSVVNGSTPLLSLTQSGDTLPHLQIWRDRRPYHNVLAIEPCTSARREDGASGDSAPLGPRERRTFRVEIDFGD